MRIKARNNSYHWQLCRLYGSHLNICTCQGIEIIVSRCKLKGRRAGAARSLSHACETLQLPVPVERRINRVNLPQHHDRNTQ